MKRQMITVPKETFNHIITGLPPIVICKLAQLKFLPMISLALLVSDCNQHNCGRAWLAEDAKPRAKKSLAVRYDLQ